MILICKNINLWTITYDRERLQIVRNCKTIVNNRSQSRNDSNRELEKLTFTFMHVLRKQMSIWKWLDRETSFWVIFDSLIHLSCNSFAFQAQIYRRESWIHSLINLHRSLKWIQMANCIWWIWIPMKKTTLLWCSLLVYTTTERRKSVQIAVYTSSGQLHRSIEVLFSSWVHKLQTHRLIMSATQIN